MYAVLEEELERKNIILRNLEASFSIQRLREITDLLNVAAGPFLTGCMGDRKSVV